MDGGLDRVLDYMVTLYTSWPRDLLEWYDKAVEAVGGSPPIRGGLLVGCGMGGSGFALDAARSILEDHGLHVVVNKSHHPPPIVGPRVPVLAVSYSGETLETIECTRRALEKGAPAAGVAGRGSTLHRLLTSHGYPAVPLENKGLPRTQLGQLVGAILGLLLPTRDARREIHRVASALDPDWALREAKRIARALTDGATPVIAACGRYALLAWRWKSELAENAKIHALIEVYPEAGHNSINAWEHTGNTKEYTFIIIKANTEDNICIHIEEWLEDHYNRISETITVDLRRHAMIHPLAAILAGSMVAGVSSTILAVRGGRDPSSITGIKRYKNTLNNIRGKDNR